VKELSDVHRQIILTRLPDAVFNQMPEAWVLALDSSPIAEWPPEMVKFLGPHLPNLDDAED